MSRREIVFLMTAMLLAAIFGGLIGDVVGSFLPEGTIKTLFIRHVQVGIGARPYVAVSDNATAAPYAPLTIDFFAITFSFGLLLKINFVSVLCVLLVFVYFRWWFL